MLFVTFTTKCLSEYDRQRLSLTLLFLNVIQIFLAISGFAVGAYISLNANSKAHLIKGCSLKPIGGTLSGCSIAMFILHFVGAKASNDCIYLRTRHRFENKLFVIVLGHVVMSAALLSVTVVCGMQYYNLKSSLNHGLLHSMKFYSKNKSWKRDFDNIQMEYRCCGSSNHTDWFKIKWMPEASLPSDKDRTFIRTDYLNSVPFSCCNPSSIGPCFHHLIRAERGQYTYSNNSFFKRGCTKVLLEVLQERILATALLVLVPFSIEVIIAVQTRYLNTSFEDCNGQLNPRGIGKCWLFGKCPRETDELQSQSEFDLLKDQTDFSSSEESFNNSNELIMYFDAPSHISRLSQTKLKNSVRTKSNGMFSLGGSGDDDLRQLLLKEMNKKKKIRD